MKELIDTYKKRLNTANELVSKLNRKEVSDEVYVRLKTKANCYRGIIRELESIDMVALEFCDDIGDTLQENAPLTDDLVSAIRRIRSTAVLWDNDTADFKICLRNIFDVCEKEFNKPSFQGYIASNSTHPKQEDAQPSEKEMRDIFNEIGEFTSTNFSKSASTHLIKLKEEVNEVIENPSDTEEYADCLLALFSAAYCMFPYDGFINAVKKKLEIVKNRTWKKQADGTFKHI